MAAGIRCVIAESFGEIFYNNCFQNGLLPVQLDAALIQLLAGLSSAGTTVTVDLVTQRIIAGDAEFGFEIEALRRDALLEGLDEITQTLRQRERIEAWQSADREQRPWIWQSVQARA